MANQKNNKNKKTTNNTKANVKQNNKKEIVKEEKKSAPKEAAKKVETKEIKKEIKKEIVKEEPKKVKKSFSLTNTIFFFGIIRSLTVRLSKLMTAAIFSRSDKLSTSLGVRRITSTNSSKVFGVNLGALIRYLSSFGSR